MPNFMTLSRALFFLKTVYSRERQCPASGQFRRTGEAPRRHLFDTKCRNRKADSKALNRRALIQINPGDRQPFYGVAGNGPDAVHSNIFETRDTACPPLATTGM